MVQYRVERCGTSRKWGSCDVVVVVIVSGSDGGGRMRVRIRARVCGADVADSGCVVWVCEQDQSQHEVALCRVASLCSVVASGYGRHGSRATVPTCPRVVGRIRVGPSPSSARISRVAAHPA